MLQYYDADIPKWTRASGGNSEGWRTSTILRSTGRRSLSAREFADLAIQPYRPVREELFNVLRVVNKARHMAGYQQIPASVIQFKRRIVRPFETVGAEATA